MPLNKVLAAVDGSEASVSAARGALALARATGGQVTLVYVVAPIALPGSSAWIPMAEVEEGERVRGAGILRELVAVLGGAAPETRVLVGPPAETIADLAKTEHFDLVVVGSTGKGAVRRLLIGSVADRVVHVCEVPVLVVKPERKTS